MSPLNYEESIKLHMERLRFIDRIMSGLGFTRHVPHESRRGSSGFMDTLLYLDAESGDFVFVCFPHEDQCDRGLEITTELTFNNKIKSPEWRSLHEVEDSIASWIEQCRRKARSGR